MRKYVLLAWLIWPLAAFADEPLRHIAVAGTGVVSAAPDMAIVRIGVSREARTAAAAMGETSKAASKVLESVRKAGVAPEDVQTAGLNLSPVWEHGNSRPPQVRGYVASNDLAIRVRDLSGLGPLLDTVVSDGANNLNGLSFSIADPAPLETEARASAVRDARDKAETLAGAAGLVLGPVQSITEGGGGIAPAPMMRGTMMETAAMPIAEGEVDVRVTVNVVFGIAD